MQLNVINKLYKKMKKNHELVKKELQNRKEQEEKQERMDKLERLYEEICIKYL